MDVWSVYSFILCLGSGLPASWSPVQGVLPSVKMIKGIEKSALCSKAGAKRKKKKPSSLTMALRSAQPLNRNEYQESSWG
jgi:hypothetical protein